MKLCPKFYGPFKVIYKVGAVAYKLQLPSSSRIYNVFYISQLKKHVGATVITTDLPSAADNNTNEKEPEAILDRITVKQKGMPVIKVLVKSKH